MKYLLALVLMMYAVVLPPVDAAEQLDLSTAETTSIASWRPVRIILNREASFIHVTFRGPAGQTKECREAGASAMTAMTALNKANLSANSLEKRTITWAQGLTPPCLGAGSVTGTAD